MLIPKSLPLSVVSSDLPRRAAPAANDVLTPLATPFARKGIPPTEGSGCAAALIVHESPILRFGAAQLLRESGDFTVVGETDGTAEACELLLRYRPELLLVGLTLRGSDGLHLVAAARRLSPETRAVVLTARNDATWVQRAFRAGARGYVLLQEQPGVLLRALRDVVAGKVHASALTSERLAEALVCDGAAVRRRMVERLTNRELLILRRLGAGEGPSHLARALHLSVKTVETHQARIRIKLGCRDSAELKGYARRWVVASSARDVA